MPRIQGDQSQDGHAQFFMKYCKPTFEQMSAVLTHLSTTMSAIDARLENIENKQLARIENKQTEISELVQDHQDFITSWQANWKLISILVAVISGGAALAVKLLPIHIP